MTHVERIEEVVKEVEYHGIYPVERVQALFDRIGLPIKVSTGWKVTKTFVKDVERSGGFCRIALGTPITDGRNVVWLLMKHYKLTNPESFIGHGRQFYSDIAMLREEALRLDGQSVAHA